MASKDLLDYISVQLQNGQDRREIKYALISAGWQVSDIEEAFQQITQNISALPDNLPGSYKYEQLGQVTTLSSATDILKDAWRVYWSRFKIFLGIAFIPMFIVLIIIGIIFADVMGFGFMNSPMAVIVIISVFFMLIIMQYWSQASLIYAIKNSEKNIGVVKAYRHGWHKIGSMFWVGLLSGIIIFGGYLLLFIPGIIFGIWFTFAAMIVVAEDLGGMNAILKSKFYVTGYWWEVLWRLIFIALVFGGISIIFVLPAWILDFMADVAKNLSLQMAGFIFNLLGSLVGLLLSPLVVIYTFLVYNNLKIIKGERTPIFSSSEKTKFILAGVFGIILFAGMMAIPALLISSGLGNARNKAMDATRQMDINQLRVSLEIYAVDHNDKYPEILDQLLGKSESLNLPSIPIDPKTKLPYEYRLLKNGKDYELCAVFDQGGKKCANRY